MMNALVAAALCSVLLTCRPRKDSLCLVHGQAERSAGAIARSYPLRRSRRSKRMSRFARYLDFIGKARWICLHGFTAIVGEEKPPRRTG